MVALVREQTKTIQLQVEKIPQLTSIVQKLRDQIARLKKTPQRPKFRPPGTKPSPGSTEKQTVANQKATDTAQDPSIQKTKEEIVVKPPHVPAGSRFKGYGYYSVQELTLMPKEVVYKLEAWQTQDSDTVRGTFLTEVQGTHFGAELRALIHGLYPSRMTQPAIFQFIPSVGIEISERQIHNSFNNLKSCFFPLLQFVQITTLDCLSTTIWLFRVCLFFLP